LDSNLPDYRFGLDIGKREAEAYGFHNGGLWGFRSLSLRLPERKLSLIHLANCEEENVSMETILQIAGACSRDDVGLQVMLA